MLARKNILIFLVCLVTGLGSLQAQPDPNARFKALFIYQFTKYIEWPASYKSGDFVIGIVGESDVVKHLNTMASTKKAGSQNIKIVKYNSAAEIGKCHIVFLTKSKSSEFSAALSKTNSNNTLLITEQAGLARKGSDINFVILDNRQKFELNKSNCSKSGLNVSAGLVQLAIPIE